MPEVQYTSSVATSEVAYSRKEVYTVRDGFTCSVDLYFNWPLRYTLLNELAGGYRVWPYTIYASNNFSGMRPVLTDVVLTPARDTKYANECQGIGYEVGIASLTYKTWLNIREWIEWQTQAIRLDPKYFKWSTDDGSKKPQGLDGLNQTVHRLILVKEYEFLEYGFPYNFFGTNVVDPDQLAGQAGFVGTVHTDAYESSIIQRSAEVTGGELQEEFISVKREFVTFGQGTLLMLDPVMTPDHVQYEAIPDHDAPEELKLRRGFKIKLRWLYRPEGHNVFWKPDKLRVGESLRGGWDTVETHDGTIYKPFPLKDHYPFLSYALEKDYLQSLPTPFPNFDPCEDKVWDKDLPL